MHEHATPSDDWLEPARTIILKMGGAPRVAKILNIHESAVYRWVWPKKPKKKGARGTGGLIPAERQKQIMAWSRQNGHPVNIEDFHRYQEDDTRAA